jgi:hypothetical protein
MHNPFTEVAGDGAADIDLVRRAHGDRVVAMGVSQRNSVELA